LRRLAQAMRGYQIVGGHRTQVNVLLHHCIGHVLFLSCVAAAVTDRGWWR
jgi:hypothetical protein